MITDYFRPQTLEQALALLARPDTHPLGGGTWLNQYRPEKYAVVDLQALGLSRIDSTGKGLEIGATTTLQQLLEASETPEALRQALRLEAGLNIRNAASVAGALVGCDGRSAFATVMLALDARLGLVVRGSNSTLALGEYLPVRPAGLITSITIPLSVRVAFESIGRSPLDRPVVCAALAQWSGGRTRLALGGTRAAPTLAMDGTEADGLQAAARSAFHDAGDEWAGPEYRREMAAALADRCLDVVSK